MAFQRCQTGKLVCEEGFEISIDRKSLFVLTKLIADYSKLSHVVVQIFVE